MRTEMPIPIPICAADGDERVAGITSSRRPKPNKRTEGGSFIIFLSFGPVGLLPEAAARQRADLAQKCPAWNGPQPDVWPEKYFFTFKHRNLEYVAGQEVVWDLEAG